MNILAGPWLGEFGWELMSWQGYLRQLASQGERIWVISRPGHFALYADFVDRCHFIEFDPECQGDMWRMSGFNYDQSTTTARVRGVLERVGQALPADTHHVMPNRPYRLDEQRFLRLGKRAVSACEIIVHARKRHDSPSVARRNWPIDNWRALLSELSRQHIVGMIGRRSQTFDVDGLPIVDLRDVDLATLCDQLASCRLVVGPSSGPMHLASICGTKHLVWADNANSAIGGNNRDRYEFLWNPFRTPYRLIDRFGFQPPWQVVLAEIEEMLS